MRGVLIGLAFAGVAHAQPLAVVVVPPREAPKGYESPDWPKLPSTPTYVPKDAAKAPGLANVLAVGEQQRKDEASVDEHRARFEAETRARRVTQQ